MYDEIKDPYMMEWTLRLWNEINVPKYIVDRELGEGAARRGVLAFAGRHKLRILDIVGDDEIRNLIDKYPELHPGECYVLLVYLKLKNERSGMCCILDEKKARRVAKTLNIPYIGTVGVIEMFHSGGIVTQETALDLLDRLERSGFHGTPELFEGARRSVSGGRPGD